ncbi:MAG: hypothetical protein COB08_006745 [Rhodobacteraceae bacterium]|nr:hypothetical protein [Paracoccaceae bacterium]
MNCFYHPDASAVGVCKACSKGLCPECAADLGHGIACKNKHEQRVEDLEFIISKNTKALRAAKKNPLIGVLFFGFMGAVFCGFGLWGRAEISWLSTVMGAGFLVFAVLAFIQIRAVWGKS